MRNRIALWAVAGFVVAAFWIFFTYAISPVTTGPMHGLRLLAGITCPISLASFRPIGLSWVLIANTATYALVGLIVETVRKFRAHPRNDHI
ncbi:MAG TPA: hypothetical protein VNU92_10515 [Edaphobacter sp.]|jgi:hypothetical protein|nr:hypothetical protein [Edaphobacter sp.]